MQRDKGPVEEVERMMDRGTSELSFTPPEALIRPFHANPLRIFVRMGFVVTLQPFIQKAHLADYLFTDILL